MAIHIMECIHVVWNVDEAYPIHMHELFWFNCAAKLLHFCIKLDDLSKNDIAYLLGKINEQRTHKIIIFCL